ncbi:MAG: hypothetical protein AB4057_07685 [Crocosphaera sp.]
MKKKFVKYGLQSVAIITLFCPQIALANTSNLTNPIDNLNISETSCKLLENKKPIHLAQRRGTTGCWKLIYSVGGIVHESFLVINGSGGKMLTTYFNTNTQRTDYVEQTMRLKNSPRGILILGYNPVYPNTSRRHPTYAADNFLLQVGTDGKVAIAMMDDAGYSSLVDVEDCPL